MRGKSTALSGLVSGGIVALLCTVPLVAQHGVTNKQSPIVVELSAKKTIVYPGEMLSLHVAIKNQGREPLYIPRGIDAINQRFVLSLRHGSKTEWSNTMAVADSFFDHPPPF